MKKGDIALGTLVGLIMAALIIYFMFRITSPLAAMLIGGSQNNFPEFISDFSAMKDALPIESRATEAVLDKGSAFVYFERGQKYMGLMIRNLTLTNTASAGYFPPPLMIFERPPFNSGCEGEGNCICFVTKTKVELREDRSLIERYDGPILIGSGYSNLYYHLNFINPICKNVNSLVRFENCGVGIRKTPANEYQPIFTYSCRHGFVVERGLVKDVLKADARTANFPYPYYEAPKRIPLQMRKEGETIILEY